MANGYHRHFIERSRQCRQSRRPATEQPKIWRALPYIDGVSEAVFRLLRPMGIGIAHRPESTIRHLVMRPKDPVTRDETTNVIYRIKCNFCTVNYIGEIGKRLQTRDGEHMRLVGEVTAWQEAWHTGTTSINRCVTIPTFYQAFRTQLNDRKSQREDGPNVHPNMVCPWRTRTQSQRNPHLTKEQLSPRPAQPLIPQVRIHTEVRLQRRLTAWGGSFGRWGY
ncbi:unnamed protein product [Schistocephalus solidus]|uniref:Uncharacterized protein n=1 Tax=Schistocephalus solidus TaxID=70667 RepID=A0A183SAA8_SCHSO|nr:unnamed protein product [Schistocephalus solidus]